MKGTKGSSSVVAIRQVAHHWVDLAELGEIVAFLPGSLFGEPAGPNSMPRVRQARGSPAGHVLAIARARRVPKRMSRKLTPTECVEIRRALVGLKPGMAEYEQRRNELCRRFRANPRQVGGAVSNKRTAVRRRRKATRSKRAAGQKK